MLNLEAMGNGGQHRMFQATKGRATAELLAMWSEAAPKPSGSVVSSDIFATGWGGCKLSLFDPWLAWRTASNG